MRVTATLVLLLASIPGLAADPAIEALAILKANCYRCHGQDGSHEGGLGAILDANTLREHKLVIPGDAEKSKLIRRIVKNQMPPPDESPRPSEADIAKLRSWIDAGAADLVSNVAIPLPDNARLNSLILVDLEKLERRSRRFQRYFTLVPLARAGVSEATLQTYRHGLAKLLNSLSWHPNLATLHRVDPAGLLLRFDLRDVLWDNTLWNRLIADYPYGIIEDTGAFRAVAANAATRQPIVRADWFLATASRPPLYYDLLQFPTTAGELERQLRIDAAADIRQERVARAGFNGSGVSRNNRLIERHVGPNGAYWRTYDFDAVAQNLVARQDALPDRRNLFAYPLGPGNTDTTFQHAGGEIIFHLPNGLLGFMLVNANDARIDKGPTAIVSDPRRPDRAVEPGISCMSCHLAGMQFKTDQVRAHVARNPGAYSRVDSEIVRALYPPEEQMKKLMEADAERYRTAIEKMGGKVTEADPVSAASARYEADVDLRNAAGEVGLAPDELRRRISDSETLARNFGPLRIDGGTVHRQIFQQSFPDLVRELRLGVSLQTASLNGNLPDNTGDLDPLEGPSSQTNAAAFSPDGRFVLLGSADRSVRLVEVASGRELRRFVGHAASVWAVAWSPDGRRALSGSLDGTLRLWDVSSGQELKRIEAHDGLVSAVAFFPDGKRALSAGFDHAAIIWDVDTGKELKRFANLASVVYCATIDRGGDRAILGGDPLAWLVDLKSNRIKRRLAGHSGAIVAAAFSPDGTRLATASDDGTARIWDADRGQCRRTFASIPGGAKAVSFQDDGQRVIVGAGSGEIRLWQTDSESTPAVFAAHAAPVAAIARLGNDQDIASVGRDSSVQIWRRTPQASVKSDPPRDVPAQSVAPRTWLKPSKVASLGGNLTAPILSRNGRWLYVINRTEGLLLRLDLHSQSLTLSASAKVPDNCAFALTKDGKALLVAFANPGKQPAGQLDVYDPARLEKLRSIELQSAPYDVAALSLNRIYVSGGGTGWTDVTVIDGENGSVLARWGGVWARSLIALTQDGSRLLTSTQGVTPGRIEALPIPEPLSEKPNAYSAPASSRVGGQFVVTPDDRYLLCQTGTVLRLASTQEHDLQPHADLGPFIAAALDPKNALAFLLREDSTLDVLSYPEMKLRSTYQTGMAASGMVFDPNQGKLCVTGIPLTALRDRPRAKAIGDVLVFDLRELVSLDPNK